MSIVGWLFLVIGIVIYFYAKQLSIPGEHEFLGTRFNGTIPEEGFNKMSLVASVFAIGGVISIIQSLMRQSKS